LKKQFGRSEMQPSVAGKSLSYAFSRRKNEV
jgi:hypothetical protein